MFSKRLCTIFVSLVLSSFVADAAPHGVVDAVCPAPTTVVKTVFVTGQAPATTVNSIRPATTSKAAIIPTIRIVTSVAPVTTTRAANNNGGVTTKKTTTAAATTTRANNGAQTTTKANVGATTKQTTANATTTKANNGAQTTTKANAGVTTKATTTKATTTKANNGAQTTTKANAGATTKQTTTAAATTTVRGGAATTTKATTTAATTTRATGNTKTTSAAPAATSAAVGGNTGNQQTSLTLNPAVIAPGFAVDGQNPPVVGQVKSLTSTNNFINFCLTVNVPITDGKQIQTGSCNPTPIGVIPSIDNMPSAKFVSPPNFGTIKANTAFTVVMAIKNMQTGFFTNAAANYFAAPQQLNGNGQIQGHSHVVIEQLTSLSQTTATDPRKFAFFKGLNAAAANGQLSADVTGGLPVGFYRLASINSASNHQPVIVPVAQHGSLDDAVYFSVTADGNPAKGNNIVGDPAVSASVSASASTTASTSATASASVTASVSGTKVASASVSTTSGRANATTAASSASSVASASATKSVKGESAKATSSTKVTSSAKVASTSAAPAATSASTKGAKASSVASPAASASATPTGRSGSLRARRF